MKLKRGHYFLISVLFVLIACALSIYYFFVYRPNQKISQRTNLPPHEVSFKHLLSLPDGESRIEKESIIFEGFFVVPERMGSNTNVWVFDLSDHPSGYVSNPPRARINRCSEQMKVNCFDFRTRKEGPAEVEFFSGLHVVTESNEKIPFGERVRLHGKLNMKNEQFGDQVRLDSIIAVAKIEKLR